jgi:hypothetical protein
MCSQLPFPGWSYDPLIIGTHYCPMHYNTTLFGAYNFEPVHSRAYRMRSLGLRLSKVLINHY